jgi:DNA-directed RNA polymerase subunit RPC12/RpoP
MFMNAACPACGHKHRVPERSFGQSVKCPACANLFQCGAASSSLPRPIPMEAPSSVQEMSQARAVKIESTTNISYRCPRCAKPLESPASMAGQKGNCPDCGQRLQIPQAPLPTTSAPSVPVFHARPTPSSPVVEESIPTVLPVHSTAPPAPVRREYCLECGADVTQRPRIQTCPDCGSLFCSARCYREHHQHAHPARGR